MKYWYVNHNATYIVVITIDKLFFGSIRKENRKKIQEVLDNNQVPDFLFGIPFSYIKKIESPLNNKNILIQYGKDSEEEFTVEIHKIKAEIIFELKNKLNQFEYKLEKPKVFKHIKPQFFSIVFVTLIFLWVYSLAVDIESGLIYEYSDGARKGLSNLFVGLAQLGTVKIILGYLFLLGVCSLSLISKLKNRTETEFLIRH